MALLIVMRIINFYKIKGLDRLQSRSERIPSSLPKKNNNAWNREVKFQTKEIFSNGRRKEITENDGLLMKLFFHL
jgi:hypothetical protein